MIAGRRRQAIAVAAAVLAAGLATGCGPTTKGEPTPSHPGPAILACERALDGAPWHGAVRVSDGHDVAFDAQDDYFEPTCLIVPKSTPVRIVVTNRGHLPHTVTLPGVGLNVAADAGQTIFVTLPATTRALKFVCTYHVSERMFFVVVPV